MRKVITTLTSTLLVLLCSPLYASDWHCMETTSQTSVDFEGKAIRSTCTPFTNLNEKAEKKERKKCEKGSRKNRAKAWMEGACPLENLISTCTVTKMGPIALPQPRIVNTYEESGGNLSLVAQVELARQQCSQMSLNSGEFVDATKK